jgi:23S rRNA C2498 (ribose-2'-O)-methylase RlmM
MLCLAAVSRRLICLPGFSVWISRLTDWLYCSALRHSAPLCALLCSLLCYAYCRDWELNFKVLKQRNKELDRLPTDMRVDCFTVATQDLKATIESHMKALSDGAAAGTCLFVLQCRF